MIILHSSNPNTISACKLLPEPCWCPGCLPGIVDPGTKQPCDKERSTRGAPLGPRLVPLVNSFLPVDSWLPRAAEFPVGPTSSPLLTQCRFTASSPSLLKLKHPEQNTSTDLSNPAPRLQGPKAPFARTSVSPPCADL